VHFLLLARGKWVEEVWGMGILEGVEIARLQNASVQLFLQADEGRGQGKRAKGQKVVQHVDW
jgi:hypothetical protein